jgi:hypothetical protein
MKHSTIMPQDGEATSFMSVNNEQLPYKLPEKNLHMTL